MSLVIKFSFFEIENIIIFYPSRYIIRLQTYVNGNCKRKNVFKFRQVVFALF